MAWLQCQERRPLDHHRCKTAATSLLDMTAAGLVSGCPPTTSHKSTGLGYASTIHGAQGVSADTMHGLLCGQESRQQLYTMLTRGRAANHLYLKVVATATRTPFSTGNRAHRARRGPRCCRTDSSPATTRPPRPRPCCENGVPRLPGCVTLSSATPTGLRWQPAAGWTSDRSDARRPSSAGVPELTSEPSWPTLRADLLALAAETGERPLPTCNQRPPVANSAAWPPYWTGASQTPHRATRTSRSSVKSRCGLRRRPHRLGFVFGDGVARRACATRTVGRPGRSHAAQPEPARWDRRASRRHVLR